MSIASIARESNTGNKRRRNEDSFVVAPPLFAVADGMGGAQAGEVASSLAAASVADGLGTFDRVAPADAEKVVVGLIRDANRLVHQRATHDAAASGMGTTMTVALVAGDNAVTIGHVGDSRAYLLRDGSLEQLTDDHSLVAELVRRGELSPTEAEVHPQRSVITRALGTDPEVEIDVFSIEARDGDVFLLCSDGLSTMVDADSLAEILERNRDDLTQATRGLIKAANDSGGDDNITAVLFWIGNTDDAEPVTEVAPVAQSSDDEDTLHPEDGVPVIAMPAAEPAAALADGDTTVLSAEAVQAAVAAVPAPEPERLPLARLLISTLLIVALAALIVLLAVWGLAR
jgi:serine/threonine protein phosphatase PrpC